MNLISRTITGIVLIVLGIFLIILAIFKIWVTLIHGVPLLILGIFILLNNKEDIIEERKDLQSKKGGRK